MDLNFQYAHHTHDQFDTVTAVTDNQAIKAFDDFAWRTEAEKAKLLQKCLPTLSIIIEAEHKLLWISSYLEGSDLHFIAETKFLVSSSSFFARSETESIRDLSNPSFTQTQARKAIELFVSESLDELEMHFKIIH